MFVQGSADAIPVADQSAAACTALTLLSSILEPWFRERIYSEVRRVTAPGGVFVVYDLRYGNPRNRSVRPVSVEELRSAFPEWELEATALTLLPPLARSVVAGGSVRYRVLAAVPLLRSHLGVVLRRPA
jgi:ubiquinone/menaquinone biosynthesis C-methylase UbiE